jgi:hypothetical protein
MMPDSSVPEIAPEAFREVCSRTIFTIDGLWFIAVEEALGFDTAFELNQKVWEKCGLLHGKRVLKSLALEGRAPLEALAAMVQSDPIMSRRDPRVTTLTDTRMVFRTVACPTQTARIRDGRGVFNGKPGCTYLFQAYSALVDTRIKTTCVSCAPDGEQSQYWCEWEFTLTEKV